MTYCKPRFGKGFLGRGMGFGSRLLPWARCRIFSKVHAIPMISPVWVRPAVGQLFRGGVDYRSYFRQLVLLGLLENRRGDLGVFEGIMKTRGMARCPEPGDLHTLPLARHLDKCQFIFSGERDYFRRLNGWDEFLHEELRAITRQKYLDLVAAIGSVPIGLCVRCGNDFDPPVPGQKRLLLGQKTPLTWFVETLRSVRDAVGFAADAFVVSDGTEEQLAGLLAEKNVRFVRPGSAVSDLLVLASAKVLLASGSSTFAAWGAFLGQMPSVSHPGQPLATWNIVPARSQFMAEFDPDQPDPVFLRQASHALAVGGR